MIKPEEHTNVTLFRLMPRTKLSKRKARPSRSPRRRLPLLLAYWAARCLLSWPSGACYASSVTAGGGRASSTGRRSATHSRKTRLKGATMRPRRTARTAILKISRGRCRRRARARVAGILIPRVVEETEEVSGMRPATMTARRRSWITRRRLRRARRTSSRCSRSRRQCQERPFRSLEARGIPFRRVCRRG